MVENRYILYFEINGFYVEAIYSKQNNRVNAILLDKGMEAWEIDQGDPQRDGSERLDTAFRGDRATSARSDHDSLPVESTELAGEALETRSIKVRVFHVHAQAASRLPVHSRPASCMHDHVSAGSRWCSTPCACITPIRRVNAKKRTPHTP